MFDVVRHGFIRAASALAIVLGTVVVVTGWLRVELDVEVLDVLPADLPEVAALRAYRHHFANERELIVALEIDERAVPPGHGNDEDDGGPGASALPPATRDAGRLQDDTMPGPAGSWSEPEAAPQPSALPLAAGGAGDLHANRRLDAAGRLAQWLAQDLQPAPDVRWQDLWEARTEDGADLVAWLLLNLNDPAFAELRSRLADDGTRQALDEALETLALTMDPGEVERVRHDPLGLTSPLVQLMADGALGDFDTGAGEGGTLRLLFVECPDDYQGYKAVAGWVEEVRASCLRWQAMEGADWGVRWLGLTGEPAFISEVAVGMEHDMRGTAGMTALAVALLFWLFHRRLRPLLWLIAMMALVLGATLGLGAWLFGSFSVMSVGFASILIGLVVDYGVVVFSEARAEPGTARELRQRVGYSILWAATTTAAVFAVMGFSSLPGVAQLGRLVALGILLGAIVMLVIYLPLAARLTAGRKPAARPAPVAASIVPRPGRGAGQGRLGRLGCHWSVWLPLLLWLGAVAVLWQRGLPQFDHGFEVLRPSESPAMEAFERVLGIDDESANGKPLTVPVVISGRDYGEVKRRLQLAQDEAVRLQRDGLVLRSMFPLALWPQTDRMTTRLAEAGQWFERLPELRAEADAAGFEPEAMALTEVVLETWRQWSRGDGLQTALDQVGESALLARLMDLNPGAPAALGTLELAPGGSLTELGDRMRAVDEDILPAAWESIAPAVEPLVWHDLLWVFTPMIALLLVLLIVVFRGWRDVVLTLAAMSFAMTLLLAWMALAGWQWNFLVITAVPLLVGAGLDYSIHLLLAVRRHAGDLSRVWLGVGRALVFCGLSTAIGFGSLALAANRGLMGLGLVCSSGLLLMMATAVLLLPRWAVRFNRRSGQ